MFRSLDVILATVILQVSLLYFHKW